MNIEFHLAGIAAILYVVGYVFRKDVVKWAGILLAFLVCLIVVWKGYLGL